MLTLKPSTAMLEELGSGNIEIRILVLSFAIREVLQKSMSKSIDREY